MIADVGDGAGTSGDAERAELRDVGGGHGTAADGERADSPTVDGDGVVAKRRRLTCSMESVEDKQEKMDDKNCGTSAGTFQLWMITNKNINNVHNSNPP